MFLSRIVFAAACLRHACAASVIPVGSVNYSFQRVRNFTGLDHAGYAFLSKELPGKLVLNRFGAAPFLGKSQVSLVDLASGSHDDLAKNIDWPNEALIVNEKVFGFTAAIVGAGFLVPSHTTGGIWIVEASTSPKVLKNGPVKITKDLNVPLHPDSGWFYHKVELVDMNGDGLLDMVTSRCAYSVESWNPKAGKLVWLEQPKTGALSGAPWTEHFIQDGPDFLFTLAPQATGSNIKACAAEYINKQLVYIHGSEKDGYATRVLDADLGPGFGCTWVDLNGDGKLDLLATNHVNKDGSVFGYSWDGDLADSKTAVTKHVLATGFSAVTDAAGTAAPGDAIPFFADSKEKGKPLVLVSEDNGNAVYLLVPRAAEDSKDWNYEKHFLEYVGADVGRIAIGDTDGDGFKDFYVPAYDAGQLVHYKMVPTSSATAAAQQSIVV